MKLVYGLFFWWTFASIGWLLGLPPGPFETVLTIVLGIAGAAVATNCLRQCVEMLPRIKIKHGVVIPPQGRSVLTKYQGPE